VRIRTYSYRHAECILNGNYRLKREMEQILAQLDLEPPSRCLKLDAQSPHRRIQRAFFRRRWQTEVLVSPVTCHRHYFDVYKDRVAVEIETSCRERLYRDYWRFLMAEADGRLDVGVIILLEASSDFMYPNAHRGGAPVLEDVMDDLKSLRTVVTVPIWVVALS